MNGAPSQIDLWDYKPKLSDSLRHRPAGLDPHGPAAHDDDLRAEALPHRPIHLQVRAARPVRHAGSANCSRTPPRSWMSWRCIKTVHTEAINHDPAVTFMLTGNQVPGKPSIGAWLSYGLGSEAENLPAFVVMTPRWSAKRDAQALYQRLWGSGFLPSQPPGRGPARPGRPGALPEQPARRGRRRPPHHAGRAGQAEPGRL